MNKYRITLMALCMAICTQAKVTLPSFFTDNMEIQQKSTLILPGKAKAGKQVTVKTSWDNRKYTVKSGVDGSFTLQLPTPAAGGPYQIELSDGEKLTLRNIMVGEVWFCSGQSNMEMQVEGWGKVMNYQQEKEEAIRDIRRQVAVLSVDIAEKIIRHNLDKEQDQMEMIDRMLDEMLTANR